GAERAILQRRVQGELLLRLHLAVVEGAMGIDQARHDGLAGGLHDLDCLAAEVQAADDVGLGARRPDAGGLDPQWPGPARTRAPASVDDGAASDQQSPACHGFPLQLEDSGLWVTSRPARQSSRISPGIGVSMMLLRRCVNSTSMPSGSRTKRLCFAAVSTTSS